MARLRRQPTPPPSTRVADLGPLTLDPQAVASGGLARAALDAVAALPEAAAELEFIMTTMTGRERERAAVALTSAQGALAARSIMATQSIPF